MSDDIKARLREVGAYAPASADEICRVALARIEALEAENFKLAAGLCNHQYGDEYGHSRCRRIDELEAQLAAAREALDLFARHLRGSSLALADGYEIHMRRDDYQKIIETRAAIGKDTQ